MKYNPKERLSDSAFSLYERLLLSGLSLSLSYAFLLQCLSRLCRCSACCSNPQTWSLPRSDTFTYFQRELPYLTSCDRLQVKHGRLRSISGFPVQTGSRLQDTAVCVLKFEPLSSISYSSFTCLCTVVAFVCSCLSSLSFPAHPTHSC